MNLKKMAKENRVIYCFGMAFRAIRDKKLQNQIWGINNDFLNFEIEECGTENCDRIIYDLCIDHDCMGFFGLMRWLCTGLIFADRFGFEPYMRLSKNTLYYDKTILDTDNPFEYFFVNSPDLELNAVTNSHNVVRFRKKQLAICDLYYKDRDSVNSFARVWRKYIRLKPDILSRIQRDSDKMVGGQKTIGVHYRGTDYKMGYKNHPVPVQIEETIQAIKRALEDGGFERIFLATDEEEATRLISAEFPGKVFYYNDVLRSEDGKALHTTLNEREHHQFLMGFEVLRDVITMSRCDGLIAGHSNVSAFADVIKTANNQEYEYFNIIDKGKNKEGAVFAKKTIKR